MTSVAAVFGALPIALGLGAGAGSRRPLGYAIIGGLVVSTMLTLFLVPAVFLLFERLRHQRAPVSVRAGVATTAALLLALFVVAPLAAQQQPMPTVTLAEARRRAVEVDPVAVTGRANAEAASWQRRSAWAELLTPQVTLGSNYTHFTTEFINFGTFKQGKNSTNATIAADYQLLGPGRFTTLRLASAAFGEASANQTAAQFRSELATDQAYYAVLSETELTQVSTDRLHRAEEGHVAARARVLAGSSVATDSLQTLLEVNRAKLIVLQRDSALTVARLALGRRIGANGPVAAAPIDTLPPPELPLTLEQATTELRQSGPEVVAARSGETRASAGLWGQRERYLPNVSLSYQSGVFDSVFFPSAVKRSQIVLTASYPLWDAGHREVAVARARAERDIAQAVREESERATAEQMAQAWNGYRTAQAALALASSGVVVSAENYRIQDVRYREGATTITELLAAQVASGEAQSSLVQTRYAARLSLARIEALLGRRLFDQTH
jgi:outer membrane protein TolC